MPLLPQWPRDRYVELAPKYWRQTRACLDDAQLELELAWFTIPPPLFPLSATARRYVCTCVEFERNRATQRREM